MSNRKQSNEDTVTVHVTPSGGRYVNPGELLRSTGAQKIMAKMDRILRDEHRVRQDGERPASGSQRPSRER